VHGNVCLASVVVTPTLDWKLHALDVLSEFDGSNESASGPMLVHIIHYCSSVGCSLSWSCQFESHFLPQNLRIQSCCHVL